MMTAEADTVFRHLEALATKLRRAGIDPDTIAGTAFAWATGACVAANHGPEMAAFLRATALRIEAATSADTMPPAQGNA